MDNYDLQRIKQQFEQEKLQILLRDLIKYLDEVDEDQKTKANRIANSIPLGCNVGVNLYQLFGITVYQEPDYFPDCNVPMSGPIKKIISFPPNTRIILDKYAGKTLFELICVDVEKRKDERLPRMFFYSR